MMSAATHLPPKTRFSDIARDLTESIASGRHPVGALLPTEMELCARYATSRHTVRAALDELVRLGLVSRRRNVGTRVEARAPRAGFQSSLGSVEDLLQFGSTHLRALRAAGPVKLGKDLARRLDLQAGEARFHIASTRLDARTGRPIGWTDIYLAPAFAAVAELAREEPATLISALIERRFGVVAAQIRQRVSALAVPAEIAAELDAAPGAPGLAIQRRYLDAAGAAFEVSTSIHPADRFELEMRLDRALA